MAINLSENLQTLVERIAQEFKIVKSKFNIDVGNVIALKTSSKTIVNAINELKDSVVVLQENTIIDDVNVDLTTTWSSSKIQSTIDNSIVSLIDNAPLALDTLNELAEALEDSENELSAIVVALDNRVKFDVPQTLTDTQKTQVITNIGAISAEDIGDIDFNFVAHFESGLA